MQRPLSMRDLKAQDLQGLSPSDAAALVAQVLEHIEQQARQIEIEGVELDAKQKLIERKDRDIAWRDAKLEKVGFELARLKRCKPHCPRHSPGRRHRAVARAARRCHKRFALSGPVLHADETPVSMLEPGAGKTKRAYVRAYARGELDAQRGVIYEFCLGRGSQYPLAFLGATQGPPGDRHRDDPPA